MKRPLIDTSDGILGGRQVTINIDLKVGVQGNYSVDMLGFSKASVEVFCTAGSGVLGIAPLEQRNTVGGETKPIDGPSGPAVLTFEEGKRDSVFGILDVTARYLVLNLKDVEFGSSGRVTIIFTQKL